MEFGGIFRCAAAAAAFVRVVATEWSYSYVTMVCLLRNSVDGYVKWIVEEALRASPYFVLEGV